MRLWGDKATPTYPVRTPSEGVTSEAASVFFCPVRPTKLDEIKNFHPEVQASAVE